MSRQRRRNAAVRKQLLHDTRERCFLHRRFWVNPVSAQRPDSMWYRLELHHVVFHSCGGSDAATNLVPLCPSCHAGIHEVRRRQSSFVPDNELLAAWEEWKGFRGLLPGSIHVGEQAPAYTLRLVLNIYGIAVDVSVDRTTPYPVFRDVLLSNIVEPLRLNDQHFPFLRIDSSRWGLSSDAVAPIPWTLVPALQVVAKIQQLDLRAPMVVALDRSSTGLSSLELRHRIL